MKKQYAELEKIENSRLVGMETDREFVETMQNGLLLALLEQGILDRMQYRMAAEKLKLQRQAARRRCVE